MSVARRCKEGQESANGYENLWIQYDADYFGGLFERYRAAHWLSLDESLFCYLHNKKKEQYEDADPETYLHAIDAWIRAIDNWEPE